MVADAGSGDAAVQALVVQAQGQGSGEVAERVVPIILPGAAGKVAGSVVDVRCHFVKSACAAHRDVQYEIAEALSKSNAAAKKSRDLPAL